MIEVSRLELALFFIVEYHQSAIKIRNVNRVPYRINSHTQTDETYISSSVVPSSARPWAYDLSTSEATSVDYVGSETLMTRR